MRTAENSGRGGIVAVLLLYLALALAFVFSVPIWEAPDEPAHFLRIRAEARRLGLVNGSEQNWWPFPPGGEPPPLDHPGLALQRREGFWKKGTVVSGYERHQPPGYYLLAAPILALAGGDAEPPFFFNHQYETQQGQVFLHGADRDPPFARARRAILLLRLLSTLFGAVTVVLIWRTAGFLVTGAGCGPLALAAAALTAFLPQFIFVTSVINNDALALALSALFFHVLLRPSGTRRLTPSRIVLLVLIFTAALLTELSLVFLLPAALAWFAAAGTERKRLRTTAAMAFAVLLPALLLLAGPGRHAAGSAQWDPLRQLDRMSSVGHGLLQWESLRETIRLFFTSGWGVFGWMSVFPPPLVTATYIAISVIIILGLLRLLGTAGRDNTGPEPAPGVRLLFTAALISLAFLVVRNALFTFQPQGRMFFPLLPLAAPLAAAGLQRIGPRIPGRMTLPVVLFMLGATFYGLLGMIRPYYVRQRAPIRFTLPAESAILYGLYGTGFEVREHAGQSTAARLEQTGALRLYNAGERQVEALLRFTAESEKPGQKLEIWDRHGLAGRFELEQDGRRFFQLDPLILPPGETVLFFHLPEEPDRGGCGLSGLTIAPFPLVKAD